VQLLALDHAAIDLVLALHKRERRDPSEAGVRHEELTDASGWWRTGLRIRFTTAT
jgi:hypothetical protein